MIIKKVLIGLYVKLVFAFRALKAINSPHLGDVVMYKGKRHVLNQGVNNPYWDLIDLSPDNIAKPIRDVEKQIHVSQFKLQPLYRRFRFSFMFTYKFLMGYWYSIELNNRLGKFKIA